VLFLSIKNRFTWDIFDDPKEAAKIYNKAALKYFGKFAKINILTEN